MRRNPFKGSWIGKGNRKSSEFPKKSGVRTKSNWPQDKRLRKILFPKHLQCLVDGDSRITERGGEKRLAILAGVPMFKLVPFDLVPACATV